MIRVNGCGDKIDFLLKKVRILPKVIFSSILFILQSGRYFCKHNFFPVRQIQLWCSFPNIKTYVNISNFILTIIINILYNAVLINLECP